jgi:acyl-CoA synthetase (AMP-forming)/AMP-acid ligase II
MPSWRETAPPMRVEAHFGDRLVRCFAPRPRDVNALLAEAVARNGDGEALVDGQRRYSWRVLDDCAARVAAGLARRGVRRGERVAVLAGNCAEFVLTWLAVAKLGAIFVPLSVRAQRPELEFMLAHCEAAALVYEVQLAERVPGTLPALRLRVAVGEPTRAEPFTALLEESGLGAAVEAGEEDAAAILYTSGTTGRPKGAVLTHLNVVHSALHYAGAMRLEEVDRSVAAVPLSHVTGLVALIATMLRCAGALVLLREFKAAAFLELAARERITHTVLVPAMYNLCLLAPELERLDLTAWRIGGYGGAPMPVATIERCAQRLPRLQLMNLYGATETTSPATMMPPRFTASHADSVGLVVACADIVVVDDGGCEVAAGETGELWIGGPMVVRGYWNDAQATAREFTAGYWHSGDVGSIDGEGFVRVFDRRKDLINRGGYKVYSAEVESVLIAHPAVIEAAVVGRACPVLGERVHAFVCLREAIDEQALRTFCAAQLSDYKVPETFTLSDEPLPRNANGKLLKRLLRERIAAPTVP